ncbi:hypothetical protein D3C76_1572360 [compost metagenome]
MFEVGQLPELAQIHCAALRRIDPGARNHGAAQVLHDLGEAQIAGGFGNQQMKAPVGFDATVVVGQQALIVVQRLAHLRHVLIGPTDRGQRCRLGFQAHAQLQDAAYPQRRIDIQP